MFCVKPAYNGLHDGAAHEIRLALYPETPAVYVEGLGFTVVKPQRQGGSPPYPVFSYLTVPQSRSEFPLN